MIYNNLSDDCFLSEFVMNRMGEILYRKKKRNATLMIFSKSIIWMTCLIIFSQEYSFAGENDLYESPVYYQRVDLSYITGAQVYNDNFVYDPGFSFQLTQGFLLKPDVGFGIGMGYMQLQNENFIPLYIEAIGFKKKKRNTPMIKFQLGYSYGWNNQSSSYASYDFFGGPFILAGLGRKIDLNSGYSIIFNWSYSHQFGRLEYEIYGGQEYTENMNYDMINLTIALSRGK